MRHPTGTGAKTQSWRFWQAVFNFFFVFRQNLPRLSGGTNQRARYIISMTYSRLQQIRRIIMHISHFTQLHTYIMSVNFSE